jgi:serine beta-lactamase-like protein LACTB, mitochondrial
MKLWPSQLRPLAQFQPLDSDRQARWFGVGQFLTICLLLVTVRGSAAVLTESEIASVDTAIAQEMLSQAAIGVALGIIRDGQIVYLKGYGLADREKNVPVSTNTMFRWASISKSVTAVAAMQLVAAGRLNLDDDIRKHVPEFPDKGAIITVGQLLRHQGGIVHYTNGKVIRSRCLYHIPHPYQHVTLAVDDFRESPLVNQPGEKFSYSTRGYILLSAAIERAGGVNFIDQVNRGIKRPLGIQSLQPDYQWINIPHRATGYQRRDGKIVRSTDTDVSWKLGGGGFISTIGDLARFATGLINRRLVDSATEKRMWEKIQPATGKPTKYAHGFSVEGEGEEVKVSHSGSQEKAKTRLVIYPRKRHGLVVMSNSRHADPGKFTTAAYRALDHTE